MGTLLLLRFNKKIPLDLTRIFGVYCHVSGAELSVFDIEKAPLKEIFTRILPLKESLIFGPYFLPKKVVTWKNVSSDVIAAVLGPNEVQGISNPVIDFDPAWPSPCWGVMKERIPINCLYKPKGLVEMIGDNTILLKPIINLLGSNKVGRITNTVQFKGELLKDWFGFSFNHPCNIISHICFGKPEKCVQCNSSYTSWRGVWVGNHSQINNCEVCLDVSGYEHCESRHPILVSNEKAAEISKIFPKKGYNLEPVYNISSNYGKVIAFICDFIDNNFSSL